MLVLGIDTSCDDTSAAVVENGKKVLSDIVSGQELVHKRYGGIVPELASRRHIEMIWLVVDEALKAADAGLDDIASVAVCHGPGLIGSLLVGCSFAKALCYSKGIALVPVNHLEGHIWSVFLGGKAPEFPFISLIVSGGHTSLYRVDGFGRYKELGRTRDDAAGEAYDKVAKMLGLGYPGGPVIDRLAEKGDPAAVDFPRAYLPEGLDFSFSGLKTAVANYIKKTSKPSVNDVCAGFQKSVVDVLMKKIQWALKKEKITRLAISGGVAANTGIRKEAEGMSKKTGIELFIPDLPHCTDNAAMIAAAGYHRHIAQNGAGIDLNPAAYLPL